MPVFDGDEVIARAGGPDSSQKKSSGLTGSAGKWARFSSSDHQSAAARSILARHLSRLRVFRRGSSARRVSAASPTSGTSIG